MKKVIVTVENCEEVAKELAEYLFDKPLRISTFFLRERKIEGPYEVSEVKALSGFSYQGGKLTIRLTPRRTIFWDVSKEKVLVIYRKDGSIVIEREIEKNTTIFRNISIV